MIQPLLSICIPTYNRSPQLRRLLTELFSQLDKYPMPQPIEILVSDNASDDGTLTMLGDFPGHLNYFYQSNMRNLGAAENWRKVVAMATGRYIWVLGDDDELVPWAVSTIVDRLQSNLNAWVLFINYIQKNCRFPVIPLKEDMHFRNGREYMDFAFSFFSPAEWDAAKLTFYPSVVFSSTMRYLIEPYSPVDFSHAIAIHHFVDVCGLDMLAKPLIIQNNESPFMKKPKTYMLSTIRLYWFLGGLYGCRLRFAPLILRVFFGTMKYKMLRRLGL